MLRNITHLRKYRDLNTGFCVHALQSTAHCQELFESCLISQTGVKMVISATVMSFHFFLTRCSVRRPSLPPFLVHAPSASHARLVLPCNRVDGVNGALSS